MNSFKVDPSDLDGFGNLIARARDDARQCRDYFTANVPTLDPVTGGIINPLVYEHAAIRARLDAMLGQLDAVLDASRQAVHAAADRYRQADVASAARVDATHPPVQRPNPRTN